MDNSADTSNIQSGKSTNSNTNSSYRYIKFVLYISSFEFISGIFLGTAFRSPLLQLLGFLELSNFISLILLFKASFRLSNTPDLQYDYGTGKYKDLSVLSNIVIYSLISMYFLGLSLYLIYYLPSIYQYSSITVSIAKLGIACLFLIIAAAFKYKFLRQYYGIIHQNIFKEIFLRSSIFLQTEFKIIAVLIASFIAYFLFDIDVFIIQLIISVIYSLTLLIPLLGNAGSSLNNVLDKNLPEPILYDFLSVVIDNHNHFCEYQSMRTRRSGDNIFLEIDLIMHSEATIEEAYNLEMKILNQLKTKYPNAVPRIYISPCKRNCIYKDNSKCPINKTKESK